jgi:hypothetical protein
MMRRHHIIKKGKKRKKIIKMGRNKKGKGGKSDTRPNLATTLKPPSWMQLGHSWSARRYFSSGASV